MARTDKDRPHKVREQEGERVPMLRGPGFRVSYVRPQWKSARQKAKAALRRGTLMHVLAAHDLDSLRAKIYNPGEPDGYLHRRAD